MSRRRYTEEEVARILDEATEVRPAGGGSRSPESGMTLAELQDIGREVGIPPERIATAASRLEAAPTGALPPRKLLGAPIGVGRTVQLDRALTEKEWARLVVDLRDTFDAKGRVEHNGPFRQWTNGNLQALLEPTESGELLRLQTLKGDAYMTLGAGPALAFVGMLLFMLAVLAGDAATLRSLIMFGAIGGSGLGMFLSGRLTLPRWAETRELQMEGVAQRLADAINRPDRTLTDGHD